MFFSMKYEKRVKIKVDLFNTKNKILRNTEEKTQNKMFFSMESRNELKI